LENHRVHSPKERNAPSESDVQAALAKILGSSEFKRSRRIGDFLRFVVAEELAGRGNRLKAFTIAREVYGRDQDFDPRTDTIVRVDAGRLRGRLAAYYESAGRNDPVRIDIPKGGYTPVFGWKTSNVEPQTLPAAVPARRRWNAVIRFSPLVFIVIAVVSGWIFLESDRRSDLVTSDVISGNLEKSSSAFLVVLPLVTLSDDPLESRLAEGLQEAVVTDMAKLSGLSVMAHASLMNLDPRLPDLNRLKREYGATHALRGSLEHEHDQIRVNVQLVDIDDGTTVWAERLDTEVKNLLDIQDVLSARIIEHLTIHTSPAERALLKQHHASSPEALALYRQALVLLMPPNDMERIITARHMFQRVIDLDPAFAGGYAGLGFTHSVTVLFLKTEDPGTELGQGIDLALKAIETDPEFGMGHATLAFAYVMSGRQDEALPRARRAIDVQPGDAFTQFVYGICLGHAGFPSEAIAPLSEALRLDPAEPRTPYRNVLGLAHFATGEYARAVELFDNNLQLGGPSGPHMDLFRASAYAELGQEEMAKSIISGLVESHPEFPFEKWLARWIKNSDDQKRLMGDLHRLGLPHA
jgi:TolB-like protein/Tfp pilus assembly protein PilF